MRKTIFVAALLAGCSVGVANAQIAVIDGANLDVAHKNASNTKEIMDSNKEILDHSEQILKALTGQRDGSLGTGKEGMGGNFSVSGAPSFGSILDGGTMSFGGLGGDAQKIAKTLIDGLQLVKQIQALVEGKSNPVNDLYNGSVGTSALLAAVTEQSGQGVAARNGSLNTATGEIGKAENVKGSVDENTRMILESARAINELIGVQNGQAAALNEDLKQRLTRESQVVKMLTPKDVNPFKNLNK